MSRIKPLRGVQPRRSSILREIQIILLVTIAKTAAVSTLIITAIWVRPLIQPFFHPMFYYWGH